MNIFFPETENLNFGDWKNDKIEQFWSEVPGLELRYTPIQAPVGPLLSTASTKLKILNAKFEISAKNWVEWSL